MSTKNNIEKFFELKPIKPGKISEISEATASSSVPPAERVNFHIGNPVQDDRLTFYYLKSILNLQPELHKEFIPEQLVKELGWEDEQKKRIEFLHKLIKNSSPYSPRGGYNIKNPIPLIKKIYQWLTSEQEEPLSYDIGEKSGRREIIISSGGIDESVRILLHSLDNYLINLPTKILSIDYEIPSFYKDFDHLEFASLSGDESTLYSELSFHTKTNKPIYLLLGKILSEESRRKLRNLCLEVPLFFVEVNDAPNHLSLAREAKLRNRVLRFITPYFISHRLKDQSINFIIGNYDLLKIFESVHFQLKGTPSSSEIELLQYAIDNLDEIDNIVEEPDGDLSSLSNINFTPEPPLVSQQNFAAKIESIVAAKVGLISDRIEKLTGKDLLLDKIGSPDYFINNDAQEILDKFFSVIDEKGFYLEALDSLKSVFVKEHPEYSYKNLSVVNGSSRTALGLLGFHCGIKEIITCDYSWTYEHCFPKSNFIPLTDDYELDTKAMIKKLDEQIGEDRDSDNIAIIFNNPHNASGKIFKESDIKDLLAEALNKNIFVIDDLAYQNVLPGETINGPKTIKQLGLELVSEGKIFKDKLNKIITVHSLSKTDCFAGARLAFVEIADEKLRDQFLKLNVYIKPNIAAILLAYMFYRNDSERINNFWFLRNRIFKAKTDAMIDAVNDLPDDRNPFNISIIRPEGSMYPRMVIENLPNGLSLDWLSSGLALQGIGLVPLSSFARTAKGFEVARKSFRLTLGGTDTPDILLRKTRRVLIDLNRLIAEEKSKYNKHLISIKTVSKKSNSYLENAEKNWKEILVNVKESCLKIAAQQSMVLAGERENRILFDRFFDKFLPSRFNTFGGIFSDHLNLSLDFISQIYSKGAGSIENKLEYEFFKDDLEKRKNAFTKRTYDRTVHPTQIYALDTELIFNNVIDSILRNEKPLPGVTEKLSASLINEYFGRNIAINSLQEGEELVCDLRSIIAAEQFKSIYSSDEKRILLSFWGDWDGSNRPSGQGHTLVASALIENVNQLSSIIKTIISIDKSVKVDKNILQAIDQLSMTNKKFWELLNHITSLTNKLEKRYKGVLPFNIESNPFRKVGMKIGIAKDPVVKLWQHNDRLEQRMLEMRLERRKKLEYYFKLNKELRKTLHGLIPVIIKNSHSTELILKAGLYRDILKRFILTPRIHQKLITAKDQFAINTTVNNITEINEISGNFGNPGMVLGLQISMSTNPEALISLDKKFVAENERISKTNSSLLPKVWSIPLFEDINTVSGIENYLDKVWDYAVQSRSIDQETKARFTEIICEIFIAGSDLSQQVGQTASTLLYKTAKHKTIEWLAKKGLVEYVRIKLGSGEPMQRQGGYYADFSSKPAFIKNDINEVRLSGHLSDSAKMSTEFAVSPLHGVYAGGDLRTLQSAISEKLRHLRVEERTQLLHHLNKTQEFYHSELIRASEPFIDTRLIYESKSLKELERLTLGKKDDVFETFSELAKNNFQQIVYGREDDVVGIHIISYFISKASPSLRDRPVDRPSRSIGDNKSQKIIERIASTIPLCKHGSLLRAISHNKAQTFVLGINQLTTGLFRALNQFSQMDFVGGTGYQMLHDRILPQLPVYEILHTLRIFQDYNLKHLQKLSNSFQPGNSVFSLLREDTDSIKMFIPLFQKELLRRHGINVAEFFRGDEFIPELLPTLRPDLAVLLQQDFFNTKPENVTAKIEYEIPGDWLDEFSSLIVIPEKLEYWREKIWLLLEEPVINQVKSFVELAIALNNFSKEVGSKELTLSTTAIKKTKFKTSLADLLKGSVDDSMRQFLTAAVQYLTQLPSEMVEVPVDIVRALNDVEQILRIEEQALSKKKQELLNFYLIQIARHVGDNG
ncbi:MAG: pyridoxal phosphate-dependent aminotransferase [Bacteroidota bacterium]